jgi:hypothetical protein
MLNPCNEACLRKILKQQRCLSLKDGTPQTMFGILSLGHLRHPPSEKIILEKIIIKKE